MSMMIGISGWNSAKQLILFPAALAPSLSERLRLIASVAVAWSTPYFAQFLTATGFILQPVCPEPYP